MGQADRAIERLAERQAGTFARRQAIDAGCSDDMARYRLENGVWLPTRFPAVYRLPPCPRTWRQELWAGSLWGGRGALIAGRSAAALYGIDRCPEGPIELLLPLHDGRAAPRGVRVRRTAAPGVGRDLDGLRVTDPETTLLGVARAVRPDVLDDIIESTLELGLTTSDRVLDAIGCRAGSGPIRDLLEGRVPGRPRQRRLEGEFWRLVAPLGLDLVRQHEVSVDGKRYFLDVAAVPFKTGFELDGLGKLRTKTGKQDFLRRATALQVAGWRLLHFGWDDVTKHPDGVLAAVDAVIRRVVA